jgi:TorA maturation chaperone TorD
VQATQLTLQDVLNPYDFFSRLITGNNNVLEVDRFKEDLKYLKLNKAPLLRLSQILQERKTESISGNEAFAILDKILEELNFSPEDIEPLLEQLSKAEPVTIDYFFEQKKNKPTSAPVPKATAAKENKTLADEFQKITSLKEKLTINQKFMFTKALFQGDFEKFTDVIQHIDTQNEYTSAMQFLEQYLNDWDQESEEFHEFMELIEKRFL